LEAATGARKLVFVSCVSFARGAGGALAPRRVRAADSRGCGVRGAVVCGLRCAWCREGAGGRPSGGSANAWGCGGGAAGGQQSVLLGAFMDGRVEAIDWSCGWSYGRCSYGASIGLLPDATGRRQPVADVISGRGYLKSRSKIDLSWQS